MGYYIQGPTVGKVKHIIEKFGALVIPQPSSFSAVPANKAIICVVENGFFDAAGFCYNEREFVAFTLPSDNRPKTWLVMDRKTAEKESDFKG